MARHVRVSASVPQSVRAVAVLAALLVACSPTTPPPSPAESATPAASVAVTATPKPIVPVKARSVTTVGGAVIAAGDFNGTKRTEIAVISDPSSDLTLSITVQAKPAEGGGDLWLKTGPNTFSLRRAKFAVADVDNDGKDDLVALYDGGSRTSRMYVMRSTGSAFAAPAVWWTGEDYNWARARNVAGGRFADRDSVVVTYQDDGARMRIHKFDSDGTKFASAATVYDSGPGKIDLARAKLAVGHFTRSVGADQIAMLYQSEGRAKFLFYEPGPSGFTPLENGWTTDADYDLSRVSLAGADTNDDGRDELVSLYTDADGSAKVHVFDGAASFAPVNGWNGEASLAAGALCPRGGSLVLGDWNLDGRADALALAPAVTGVRTHVLTGATGSFAVSAGTGDLRCPVWPLNGMPTNGADTTARPLYVKIDNNPSARPHYGIAKADQVYEWLVEGLTTRLAAVFHSQRPDTIGSVRSARMTDLPILPSLGAAFVYSGGGPEELMAIHYDDAVAHRYVDIAPSYGWGYRVEFRHAPYNYFTSYAALKGAIEAAPDGAQPAIVASWSFLPTATGDPTAGGFVGSVPATRITIPYRALFGVSYTYDAATRTYARFDDGVREIDGATNQAIAARDIVVIQTDVHFTEAFGLDPAGNPKLDMVLTGTGRGSVFRDGLRQDVTWERRDIVDAFTLRNANGEIVQLSPGQSWIHVVPKDWTIPSS